jgi:putative intracellular protease/amidase
LEEIPERKKHDRLFLLAAMILKVSFMLPREIFENAGANIRVASISTETATGPASAKVKVDQAITDVKLDQLNAVVIVGGMGAVTYGMNDEHLLNLLVAANKSNKIVSDPPSLRALEYYEIEKQPVTPKRQQ